jgi:hypothetical protein
VPNQAAEVAGVLVTIPRENLQALDAREVGYERVQLSPADLLPASPGGPEIFTYTSRRAAHRPGNRDFPIWRSYLECVLAGFLSLGGAAAAHDFVVTTDGWEAPILDDRTAPKYMRAVLLSPDVQRQVDAIIDAHGLEAMQFFEPKLSVQVGSDDKEFG